MQLATELVRFQIQPEVAMDEFIRIVDGLEVTFHAKQPGFVDTELLYDESNGSWMMIQHWQSLELMKAASRQMFQSGETLPFRQALVRESVKMTMLPQLKRWQA